MFGKKEKQNEDICKDALKSAKEQEAKSS